jgi:ABC-2 type transport system permease protein
VTRAIVWTELKLLFREPLVLVVGLLFPILLMVLLLVSFGDEGDDPVFAGVGGAEFYVTSYLAAAVAAMGFMATPTHLASYRASGVLRRFQAAGLRPASILVAQIVVTATLAAVGAAAMLTLAFAGFDLTGPRSVAGVVAGLAVGVVAFAAIGVLLGSIIPTARAAQGLGLLLFFGTFFLVGGGPPPGVLPDAVNTVAGATPTGLLVDAIRSPWVGRGVDVAASLTLAAIAVAADVLAIRRLDRPAG